MATTEPGLSSEPLPPPTTFPGQPSPTPEGFASTPTVPAPADCPASGVYVWIDGREAAMGLRGVYLYAANCSGKRLTLRGYPGLELLDDEGHRLAVTVRHGVINTGWTDPGPSSLTLGPGKRAFTQLTWRNLTEMGPDPITSAYVRITAEAGAVGQVLALDVDTGTTGRVAISACEKPRTP